MATSRAHRVLPGFGLSLGYTLAYLSLIVLIPLSAVFIKMAGMTAAEFWKAVADPPGIAAKVNRILDNGAVSRVELVANGDARQGRQEYFEVELTPAEIAALDLETGKRACASRAAA